MNSFNFTWDENKNIKNQKKHNGISFDEAKTVFSDSAHRGNKYLESVNVYLVFNPKKKCQNDYKLIRDKIQPEVVKERSSEICFKELVNHVKSYVDKKLENLNKSVFKNDIHSKGLEYWRKKEK